MVSNRNRNGIYLKEVLPKCQLQALNIKFQKRKGKLWTFQYPNGARAQIEYILINSKWKKSVRNCEAYNSMTTVKSNHRLITAQVRLSLRFNIKIKKALQYDRSIFRADENIRFR